MHHTRRRLAARPPAHIQKPDQAGKALALLGRHLKQPVRSNKVLQRLNVAALVVDHHRPEECVIVTGERGRDGRRVFPRIGKFTFA
jgi:hypothetical protein